MTLYDELQRIADRAPVADVPDDTWSRARRARRRNAALTVAGVAAALALVAGAIAWLPDHTEPPVADTESLGVPDHLYAVPERMSGIKEDGSWARDEVTDDPTVVGVGAAAWVTNWDLPVVVGASDGAYHLLDLPDFPRRGSPVAVLSPDGRDLAYGYAVLGSDAGTSPIPSGIRVVDLTTGELREIPVPGKRGTAITQIEWSPDGSWLAFAGRQQSTWTADTMRSGRGSSVIGRIAPGINQAEVEAVSNTPKALSVDDDGSVQYRSVGPRIRVWGAETADARDLDALGRVDDRTWLLRVDGELRLALADGSAQYPVGAVEDGVGHDLSVAVDLVDLVEPTVERPKPDWPWSEERLSITIGLGVAAAIAVLLGLRRLWRHWRQSRAAR